jgi:hypothetical protein
MHQFSNMDDGDIIRVRSCRGVRTYISAAPLEQPAFRLAASGRCGGRPASLKTTKVRAGVGLHEMRNWQGWYPRAVLAMETTRIRSVISWSLGGPGQIC